MIGDVVGSAKVVLFIKGGCVSEEVFEADFADCMLEDYIAQTSITSVGMKRVSGGVVRRAREALTNPCRRSLILNDPTFGKIAVFSTQHVLIDFGRDRIDVVRSGVNVLGLPGEIQEAGYTT